MNIGFLRKIIYICRKERVVFALNEIRKLHHDDNDTLFNYTHYKIDDIFQYANSSIEYYNNFFKLHPFNYQTDDLISNFPFITKKEIKTFYKQMLNKKEKGYMRSTSGTTGEPFVFIKDLNASAYMDAMMYHVYGWHGILPTDRQARLWGRAIDYKGKIIQGAKDYLLNRRRFSAFEMGDDKSLKYYELLLKFKPKYFYCYPSTLYQFALYLEKKGIEGKQLEIKIAICTGEILFFHYRKKIEEIFGCRVVSEYGSTENGIIGFECPHGKMHVLPTIHLEIKDPDDQGYGHIAVTELNSRSIPFIRYLNGDIGRLVNELCSCGRCYPVLEIREGRIDDYIKCPNGEVVYDAILAYTLKGHVDQFKAYQKDINLLCIDYLNVKIFSPQKEKILRKTLQKYLGSDMNITFEKVEKIVPDRSGKMRYFVPLDQAVSDTSS
jgi:phenylacetate-CoA ligase